MTGLKNLENSISSIWQAQSVSPKQELKGKCLKKPRKSIWAWQLWACASRHSPQDSRMFLSATVSWPTFLRSPWEGTPKQLSSAQLASNSCTWKNQFRPSSLRNELKKSKTKLFQTSCDPPPKWSWWSPNWKLKSKPWNPNYSAEYSLLSSLHQTTIPSQKNTKKRTKVSNKKSTNNQKKFCLFNQNWLTQKLSSSTTVRRLIWSSFNFVKKRGSVSVITTQ